MLTNEQVQKYVDARWPNLYLSVCHPRATPSVIGIYGHVNFQAFLDQSENIQHLRIRLVEGLKAARKLIDSDLQKLGEENANGTDAPDVQEEDSEETKDAGRVHEDRLD